MAQYRNFHLPFHIILTFAARSIDAIAVFALCHVATYLVLSRFCTILSFYPWMRPLVLLLEVAYEVI